MCHFTGNNLAYCVEDRNIVAFLTTSDSGTGLKGLKRLLCRPKQSNYDDGY